MSSLAVDNNNSNDSSRILNKSTNLSPTQQQQQVPPNINPNFTAPITGERSRSPPAISQQQNDENSPLNGTPQRSAEVIQNRNATDGNIP